MFLLHEINGACYIVLYVCRVVLPPLNSTMSFMKCVILSMIILVYKSFDIINIEPELKSIFKNTFLYKLFYGNTFQPENLIQEHIPKIVGGNSVIRGRDFKQHEFKLKVDFASSESGAKIISFAPAITTVQNIQVRLTKTSYRIKMHTCLSLVKKYHGSFSHLMIKYTLSI